MHSHSVTIINEAGNLVSMLFKVKNAANCEIQCIIAYIHWCNII